MDNEERDKLRKIVLQRMRYQSLERVHNRKLEREVLQYKSKQSLSSPEQAEMMAHQEPMLFEELSLRRSNNYMTGSTSNKYPTKLPAKQLKQVITPKVLKMDRQGCDNILSAFDGMTGGAHGEPDFIKYWVQENRNKTRQKFINRHEQNIQRERKAGIYKPYQTISQRAHKRGATRDTRNIPFTTQNRNVISNRRTSNSTSNKKGVFLHEDAEVRDGNIVGSTISNQESHRQSDYGDIQMDDQIDNYETVDRNQIEEIKDIYSEEGKESDHLYQEIDEREGTRYGMEAGETGNQFYDSANDNAQNDPDPQNTRRQAQMNSGSDTLGLKFPNRNPTTERLAQPKKEPVVTNPFLYSDFRGMLHADCQEAIENLDVNPDYPRSMSMSKGFAQGHPSQTGTGINLKGRKKFSESVKEMFPMPEFNSYLSDPTKKKDRIRKRKPHTAAIGFRNKGTLNTKEEKTLPLVQTQQEMDNASDMMSKPVFSQFGTTNLNRARTSHIGQRNMSFKQMEEERKEIEDIQSAMRDLEDIDQRADKHRKDVTTKRGYPKITLVSDLKKLDSA
eukprot:CAMPEP_0196999714 /NCGR_PEP_ID=MMETSP1380-20130617/4823_1 /TAXON_ID=5936 /ORGANISM="Euplotes crassus, Strain CT5" /LENGTH=559 /DNA_ID=CAMNT_0042416729 /DNA_START=80 /DNA_END=1759 /DNA_ORIENTATION=+